jgi:transposase InsO family protein
MVWQSVSGQEKEEAVTPDNADDIRLGRSATQFPNREQTHEGTRDSIDTGAPEESSTSSLTEAEIGSSCTESTEGAKFKLDIRDDLEAQEHESYSDGSSESDRRTRGREKRRTPIAKVEEAQELHFNEGDEDMPSLVELDYLGRQEEMAAWERERALLGTCGNVTDSGCNTSCEDCTRDSEAERAEARVRKKERKRRRISTRTTDGGAVLFPNGAERQSVEEVRKVCGVLMKPKYNALDLKKAQRSDVITSTMIECLKGGAEDERMVSRNLTQGQKAWLTRNRNELELSPSRILLRRLILPGDVVKRVIIVPQLYQFEVMNHAHDMAGHQGENKTFARIAERFDWPGMREDVCKYVGSCLLCQEAKGCSPKKVFGLKPIVTRRPNELVQIDFEKLSEASDGNIGLLVVIDHFTKYARAFPMKAFTAKAAVKALMDGWFTDFGIPEQLQSDQGSQFEAELFQEFALLAGTRKIRSTAYHPQTNGLVERQNRTLVAMLRVACSRYQNDWPEHVRKAIFAYNCSRHESTGLTPNVLMLGRNVCTPIWWMFPHFDEDQEIGASAFARKYILNMGKFMELARANLRASQERQRRNHDKKLRGQPVYKVGDLVMVYVNVVRRGGVRKLERQWRGPFKVTEVFQGGRVYSV